MARPYPSATPDRSRLGFLLRGTSLNKGRKAGASRGVGSRLGTRPRHTEGVGGRGVRVDRRQPQVLIFQQEVLGTVRWPPALRALRLRDATGRQGNRERSMVLSLVLAPLAERQGRLLQRRELQRKHGGPPCVVVCFRPPQRPGEGARGLDALID